MRARRRSLTGAVLVVTGASSGIGLRTARDAALAGARVFLAARDEAALDRVCVDLRERGAEVAFRRCDVSSEAEVVALAEAAVARFGRIDAWINCAGVGLFAHLQGGDLADHRRLFETNYWGVVHGSNVAVRWFLAQGGPASLVNVGSAAGEVPLPFSGAYSASKAAVKAFTNALRMELRRAGTDVAVTLIVPAGIDTEFADHAETPFDERPRLPPPRYRPEVVAAAILASIERPRREVLVGWPAVANRALAFAAPDLAERAFARVPERVLLDRGRSPAAISSLRGVPDEGHERSGHERARSFSLTTLAQLHPLGAAAALGAAIALTIAVARGVRWLDR